MFPPLAIIFAFFLMCDVKRRRRLAGAIREIIRPSDRPTARPLGRLLRRSVVVIFGLATLLAVGTWVASYTGIPTKYARWRFDPGTLHVYSYDSGRGHFKVTFHRGGRYVGHYLSIYGVAGGRVALGYRSPIAEGTIVPTHDLGLAGFRWCRAYRPPLIKLGFQRSNSRSHRDHRRSSGAGRPQEKRLVIKPSRATYYVTCGTGESEAARTTDELYRDLVFPCWVPVLLFSTWPIIAFIRGPYRRAGQRAKGFCYKCGYNLTGLIEPRCPECGTPMSPDQVNRRTSVSVLCRKADEAPLRSACGGDAAPSVEVDEDS